MADTLKQFGNDTDITYTELTTGQSIVSTTGSQKAVIKDISIGNPEGRTINVSIDSASGTKVATTKNKVDTLSGNLILDNSQSLHLSTPDTCAVTEFRARGWGEGPNRSENGVFSWGNVGTQFNPSFRWNGSFGSPDVDTGTGDLVKRKLGLSLTNPSNGFEANGYWYWNMRSDGCSHSRNTMHRTALGSTAGETPSGTVTSYGTNMAYLIAYDGSRYIYTMGQTGTTIRKYDTNTLGTSDTYTSITILQPDSDSNAQTVSLGDYNAGSYFRDGFWLVNSNGFNDNSTAPNDAYRARIIDVATGKSRLVNDNGMDDSSDFSSVGRATFKRALGIAKDSKGVYWAFLGQVCHYNSNNDNNKVWGCELGKNIATDFLANGKTIGTTYSYKLHEFSTVSDWTTRIRKPMSQSGYMFGNDCGAIMYTPGLDQYLYVYVDEYAQTASGSAGFGDAYRQIKFDFDQVLDGMDKFASMDSVTDPSEDWCYTAWIDPDLAASAFGTVKARTTGILVT